MRVGFFYIGPGKTATTWLFKVLEEHPEICLPPSKDLNFFDSFHERGVRWYHRQFGCDPANTLVGDVSHDYLLSDSALARIREYNSEAKLIVGLRNPYERAESGLNFLNRNGFSYTDMQAAAENHVELVRGGLYGENLRRVYRYFPGDQVLLADYSLLVEDPAEFIARVCSFLGVEVIQFARLNERVNERAVPRSRWLASMVKALALKARALGLNHLVGQIKLNPLVVAALYRPSRDGYRLTASDVGFLAKYFEPDISDLESLTGRSFGHWREGGSSGGRRE
ncbi:MULTISPECIES: sulfotransferase domain-containing protein [Halomonadaceae]|uniref:Sulfotransferase domain-containing protein n=1 Tax=Vreelandella halophila TaxID=86177 RepID=A0A9X4YAK8_9GAMM|nr:MULTISPECIES: sulfotransferase domain-containing protein [Halomonas]MYL25538.1 hypothetical protein [Halomonas utahensis]MYL74774.1 hypothetical protein [Halomonas sp. 22501_18_FS]